MVNMRDMLGMITIVASVILVTAICGCNGTISAPGNLVKVSEVPCKVQWTDNSNNEEGFNIYIGGSCGNNCSGNIVWTKAATVAANVETYTWVETCCETAECSCVMVRAYAGDKESADSNVITLAPVC